MPTWVCPVTPALCLPLTALAPDGELDSQTLYCCWCKQWCHMYTMPKFHKITWPVSSFKFSPCRVSPWSLAPCQLVPCLCLLWAILLLWDLSSGSSAPLISPGLTPSALRPTAKVCREKALPFPRPTIYVTQANKRAYSVVESEVSVSRSMVPLQLSPGTGIGVFFTQVVF